MPQVLDKSQTAVIILAAGKSSRMGSPKFLLKFDENRCFLQKIIEDYIEWGINEVIVVLNSEGSKLLKLSLFQLPDLVTIIVNNKPESSRVHSVKTGLFAIKNASCAFIHNVDNPFVENDVLNSLFFNKNKGDFIVPSFNNQGGHPILINEKLIKSIIKNNNNSLTLKEFLDNYLKFIIKTKSKQVLVNINDMTEFRKYFADFN